MKDIWYALDYQDRRINKLIEENQEYKDRLKYTEKRLNVEIKDIKKQISGIKGNLESIVDIVKVISFLCINDKGFPNAIRTNSKKY